MELGAVSDGTASHTQGCHTREGGYPVRRSLSVSLLTPLEYWIVRLSLSSGGHSADPVAGDDNRIYVRILATHCARAIEEISALSNQRAQGMPGARCTRGLMRKCAQEVRA